MNNLIKNSTIIGYLAVLFATACWAMSGIFIKFISDASHISPLALAFWRDFSTSLVLFAGLAIFYPAYLRINPKDLGWMFAVGAGIGTFHVFWNLGITLNGAAITTVQQAAMPAIVTVVAWMLWNEPLIWRKILAIILTFIGTALVSGLGNLGPAEMSLTSLLIGFGLPVSYACWNLFGKKVRQQYHALTILAYAFGAGALVLLPFLFFTHQPWPVFSVTWLWFVGLIGISTIGGFSTYTFALGRLPASVASILSMAEIAFVVIFAYILLDEWMTITQIAGTAMVVGGVILLLQRKRKQRKVSLQLQTR